MGYGPHKELKQLSMYTQYSERQNRPRLSEAEGERHKRKLLTAYSDGY